MTKLEQIVTAFASLARAIPGIHSVSTMEMGDARLFVRLSATTDECFAALVTAFGARTRAVEHGDSEWDIGEVNVGDDVKLEISGRHRPKRVIPEVAPAVAGDDADAALAQANGALS